MELKISSVSPATASSAENEALMEISRLSKILSGYDPGSGLSTWSNTREQPVHISVELFEVLDLFDQWRTKSGRTHDAAAELIAWIWKKAAFTQILSSPDDLKNAASEVHQSHWRLDHSNQTAIRLNTTPLKLNSFFKSYIIKHAAAQAMIFGKTEAVVVNIGGDIVVAGTHLKQ